LLLVLEVLFVTLGGRAKTFILLCVALLFLVGIPHPLESRIYSAIPSQVYRSKMSNIIAIINVFHGGHIDVFRFELYGMSLRSFLHSPLIGIGAISGTTEFLWSMGIGGHSEAFDYLARFGLMGALPVIFFFVAYFRRERESWSGTGCKKYYDASILAFLAMSIVNISFLPAVGAILALFAPSARSFYGNPIGERV